ncbi:arginine/serine-rich coiled-coil protein 2 isoform X2 [Drosophila sulfurigaster albostrigata]|uniref:arginine/serine-rich coiled-coil protein 2 isoform X2 n=1 Tax=Drosophila sulfurigaster albostrigata TaxID=89887 RepID=UPI002D21E1F3|nr:arginine/serine-rich coiled-coil protein 2 isoform X2 [Drosophila sulfurigaster albostrigata]
MSAEQDALRLFIIQSKEHLQQLLNRLQWTEEGVLKHRVPAKSKETSEQKLPPSCMTTPQRSVQLSEGQLQQLLGKQHIETTIKSVDDLQFSYSAEEKLLLYEHVLERTPRQRESFEENTNFAQLVAETKRAHQKQRRHRKTKPTLHEQLHQLVELQMQAMIKQQRQLLDKEHQRQLHATYNSRRQRSRSRSRDRSRFREHHKPQQRRQRSRSRSRKRHKHQKHRRKRSRSSSPSHSRARSRSRSRSHRRHHRSHHN